MHLDNVDAKAALSSLIKGSMLKSAAQQVLETAIDRGQISTRELSAIISSKVIRNKSQFVPMIIWLKELLQIINVVLVTGQQEIEYRRKFLPPWYEILRQEMKTLWSNSDWAKTQIERMRRRKNVATHGLRSSRRRRAIGSTYDFRSKKWDLSLEIKPEDVLIEEEQSSRIKQAIASLPSMQRKIITQSIFEGKTTSEISLEVNLPKTQIKEELKAAYKLLRTLLKDFSD